MALNSGLHPTTPPNFGLVLTGGGARAAYQVGVLEGVAALLTEAGWPARRNPFRVICGTSAGAINAAALAAGCEDFGAALGRVVDVWHGFRAAQVYRADARGALGNAAHWLTALTLGWLMRSRPRSMFDNSPLRQLLESMIDFDDLNRALAGGSLDALAITASSYTSGQHVTYYQSREPIAPWARTQRLACPARLDVGHLMASSAIPFVFPAVPLHLDGRREFFGDGSMRQAAPISPAIHLGADRVLVIGAGQLQQGTAHADHTGSQYLYPNLAQVAGHAMASIFLDGLANDIERLERVNRTLALIPEPARRSIALRPIDVLVIAPSRRLDALAKDHIRELPRSVRTMLRMLGATEKRGAGLASYLLFERGYTRRLIRLGREDVLARRDEVLAFFGGPAPRAPDPSHPSHPSVAAAAAVAAAPAYAVTPDPTASPARSTQTAAAS